MSGDENAPRSAQPRLGAVSLLHRFGSALNRHVHLPACVTDGVFSSGSEGVGIIPARGPPTDWGELVQTHDDRDVVHATPDEVPVIDIHSL